jgi:hypothetical protein
MELTAVESSHIEAIGYLKADRVLLVRFKTGALYARPCVDPHEYLELERAPSKGVWLKRYADLIRISRKEDAQNNTQSTERVVQIPEARGPLNVIQEDAEKCCRQKLAMALNSQLPNEQAHLGRWECPVCGTEFCPHMSGPVRHWQSVPAFAIVRPR